MAQLRAGLAEIVGAADNMIQRLSWGGGRWCGGEAAAAFVGVVQARLIQGAAQSLMTRLELLWHLIQVVPLDLFITGVAFGSQKPGVPGDLYPTLHQRLLYFGAVEDGCQDTGVGATVVTTAGTTIVGREVGIILAAGAVAHDHGNGSEAVHQADIAQEGLRTLYLLFVGIADAWCFRRGFTVTRFSAKGYIGHYRQVIALAQPFSQAAEGERSEYLTQQGQQGPRRGQGEHAEDEGTHEEDGSANEEEDHGEEPKEEPQEEPPADESTDTE